MSKRVAAFIITLVMAVLSIPQAAFASEPYALKVAGIQVTGEGPVAGPGITGSVAYDPASRTLTLNGAAIKAPGQEGDEYSGIFNKTGSLTIHLIGDNIIDRSDGGDWRNALYTAGPLTITAEPGASLALTAKGGASGNYGISAHKGLTIAGGDITAIGGDSGETAEVSNYGIFVETGVCEISGGSLTAVANDTNSSKSTRSFGLFCDVGNDGNNLVDGSGNIIISNAIVSATGGAAESSGGILSKYHMNICGDATVVAVGGSVKENDNEITKNRAIPRSIGLGCADMGTVTIKDSTVIATGGSFSLNGMTGDVTKQVGRSCGIFCGHSASGVIMFQNCVVAARAGTVDGRYGSAESMRCAVYNVNSHTTPSEAAIRLVGAKVAGAAGYGGSGLEMQPGAGLIVIKDYAINFGSYPPTVSHPLRTVIGIAPNDEPRAATGVVIVPDGWTASAQSGLSESLDLGSGGAAIVNLNANAMPIAKDAEIKTAGHTLAAVSLYEGAEGVDTAGIGSDGSYTLSGGGEVIAVGGLTNGTSYGVKNSDTPGNAVVDATTLTAYGSDRAMNAAPVLDKDSKFTAVVAYPAKYEPSGIAGYRLMKLLPAFPLKVHGVQVTGVNKSNVLGDGAVRFDPQSTLLTLEDATANGISSQGLDLNLALTGTNAIGKDSDTGLGIDVADGDLTIRSDGESSVGTDAVGGVGLSVDGSLTVNGKGSLTIAASGSGGTGVRIPSGGDESIKINGGTFTASGLDAAVNEAPDLTGYAGYHTVTASANADGSDPVSYDEAEIAAYKYINIKPATPPKPGYDIPMTGDSAAPGLWIGMLLLMGVGLAVSVALARRGRRRRV